MDPNWNETVEVELETFLLEELEFVATEAELDCILALKLGSSVGGRVDKEHAVEQKNGYSFKLRVERTLVRFLSHSEAKFRFECVAWFLYGFWGDGRDDNKPNGDLVDLLCSHLTQLAYEDERPDDGLIFALGSVTGQDINDPMRQCIRSAFHAVSNKMDGPPQNKHIANVMNSVLTER